MTTCTQLTFVNVVVWSKVKKDKDKKPAKKDVKKKDVKGNLTLIS